MLSSLFLPTSMTPRDRLVKLKSRSAAMALRSVELPWLPKLGKNRFRKMKNLGPGLVEMFDAT